MEKQKVIKLINKFKFLLNEKKNKITKPLYNLIDIKEIDRTNIHTLSKVMGKTNHRQKEDII